jgi:hypothetical protein
MCRMDRIPVGGGGGEEEEEEGGGGRMPLWLRAFMQAESVPVTLISKVQH